MQVVIACVLSLAVTVLGKPFYGQFLRVPRSHGYGSYISPISPCAAAGGYHSLPLPAYHGSSYGLGPVGYPHAQIAYGGGGGYGGHYRADDMEDNTGEEPEMMSFSEMDPAENTPEARYVSLGGAGAYGAPHSYSTGAAASPGAVGVFPGAHISGCNVPLLLSCSPSIVPGRIVSHGSHGAASSYGAAPIIAPSYGAAPSIAPGIALASGAGAYRSEAEPHEQTHEEHTDASQHTTTVHEAANIGTRTQ